MIYLWTSLGVIVLGIALFVAGMVYEYNGDFRQARRDVLKSEAERISQVLLEAEQDLRDLHHAGQRAMWDEVRRQVINNTTTSLRKP